MCYKKSADNVAHPACRMCKAFKPLSGQPCPHQTELCTNRAKHPAFDVEYLRNAEVKWFNACGFCKYANLHPDKDLALNPGWPGCCRPLERSEYGLIINLHEWQIISRIHGVPIPPEVHARLAKTSPPSQSVPIPIHQRQHSGGVAGVQQGNQQERPRGPSDVPGLVNGVVMPTSSHEPAAPAERRASGDRTLGKRTSATVGSVPAGAAAPVHPVNPVLAPRSINTLPNLIGSQSISPTSSSSSRNKGGSLDQVMAAMKISRPPPADDEISLKDETDYTVTSEGFTDYLSDESEAELNRQALERAQLRQEEDEFKAARAKLVTVDTTPPVDWSTRSSNRPRQGSLPASTAASHSAQPSSNKAAAYPSGTVRVTSVAQISRAMAAQPRHSPPTAAAQIPRVISQRSPAQPTPPDLLLTPLRTGAQNGHVASRR